MGFNSAFKGLNAELNPICDLLALLGAHHIFQVSGLRVDIIFVSIPETFLKFYTDIKILILYVLNVKKNKYRKFTTQNKI